MGDLVLPAHYPSLGWAERRQVRLAYVEQQNGMCKHCVEPLSGEPADHIRSKRINWRLFPKNFTRHPVHLHHCHKSGLTIGAVHALCNAVLWQFHGE